MFSDMRGYFVFCDAECETSRLGRVYVVVTSITLCSLISRHLKCIRFNIISAKLNHSPFVDCCLKAESPQGQPEVKTFRSSSFEQRRIANSQKKGRDNGQRKCGGPSTLLRMSNEAKNSAYPNLLHYVKKKVVRSSKNCTY